MCIKDKNFVLHFVRLVKHSSRVLNLYEVAALEMLVVCFNMDQ